MKNKFLKRILCAAAALILLIGALTALAPALMRRHAPRKYFEFYAYAQEYDVLFLGGSHVLNGVIPIQLWEEQGVTAYNLGLSDSTPAMQYWTLKNALEFSSPDLVVLDVAALSDAKVSASADYNHAMMDDLRHLGTKIAASFDLFGSLGDRLGYLFPQRDEDSGDLAPDGKLGFHWLRTVKAVTLPDFTADAASVPDDNVSVSYLRRMIELCQAEGIQVLLTTLPYQADEAALADLACLPTLAAEYGLRYLSADELAACLNPEIDFANSNHVNLSGAQKLTRAIGSCIAESYALPDHRTAAAYGHWDDLSETYHHDYRYMLQRQDSLTEYLMALRHEGYTILIDTGAPQLLKSPAVRTVLENLGVDPAGITHQTDCILLSTAGESAYLTDFWGSPTARETFAGRLSLGSDASGKCILTLDKKTVAEKDGFGADDTAVTFHVLDSETHKVLNTRTFSAADFLTAEAAQLLAAHGQNIPAFADDVADCTEPEKLYVLPDGHFYVHAAAPDALPAITVETAENGYWYGNEGEPLGVFNENSGYHAKRTGLIPVTPGDELTYRGFAEYTPDSVVWLNERKHFIADAKYDAKHEAVIVTAPEKAAYVWFASFAYDGADEVILEVEWITCQAAASSFVWTDTGVRLYPEE